MLNQCSFIGNMGADPETRAMPNGDVVTNFRIAVSEKWKDKQSGERKEKTEWISCVAWRGLGEVVGQYGHKGMKVFVQGKMSTRKWQDKQGNDRYTTEITAEKFEMLSRKGDSEGQRGGDGDNDQQNNEKTDRQQGSSGSGNGNKDFDDDIPF